MNRADSTDKPVTLTAVTDQLHEAAGGQLLGWPWNISTWCDEEPCNATCNVTNSDLQVPGVNYGAAILVLIPMLTVFGNSLVVVSVIREKTLRTVTNYFIVSLATSDVMVALLVMPLSIYSEVSQYNNVIIIIISR